MFVRSSVEPVTHSALHGVSVRLLLVLLLGDKWPCKDRADSWKHCLIMDEVDGMAGNEDRGGIQVLQVVVGYYEFCGLRCINVKLRISVLRYFFNMSFFFNFFDF